MLKIENLTLIGTSHISPESVKQVRKAILEIEPAIVAIELDKGRFLALMGKKKKITFKDVRALGVKGFLFMMVGAWVEEKLGKMVGTKPGDDMKAAIRGAAKVKAKMALIDQDIQITLKNFFKSFTFKEKMRVLWDISGGLIFKRQEIKGFDLKKVPGDELIEKLLDQVKGRYPSFYKTLISDRNRVMSKKLKRIMKENPDSEIVAVVGAGHVKGMKILLEK
jgi:pheromone shutdown-related protein TraB